VRMSSLRSLILAVAFAVAGCTDATSPPKGAGGNGNSAGGTTSQAGGSPSTDVGGSNTLTGGALGAGGGATGGSAAGGMQATGGAGDGTSTVDCNATMPTGGTQHTGNTQGGSGDLAWSLWMNGSGGSITTFSTAAFSASWGPSSGDYLARLGAEWGNSGPAYDTYTITAQFVETKSGNAGGYSYIGIYGWSINPCIEYYIVEDSFNTMPVNPGSGTSKGTASIDGGTYNLYLRPTTGTGGNRCGSSVTSWNQFYSIRQKARTCGTISISQHFSAWAAQSMTLGTLLEAKVVIEAGGGTGSINFPIANVTAQ